MIVIDPGHGGTDPGAVGFITEKDMNLLISEYQYNRFKELGIPVDMTRYIDETISPSNRVERALAPFGNSENVVILSNHQNAGGGEGFEVYYSLDSEPDLASMVNDEIIKTGRKSRGIKQKASNVDPTKDFFFIIRDTRDANTLLLEYGFVDTKSDAELLQSNYEEYAEAVVKAVTEFLGYNYTPPSNNKNTYTVKSGDSLYNIARRYGTTVDVLKQANNLTSNTLFIGQELIIPSNTNYTTYTVQPGDSLYEIARRYDTTVNSIKRANGLTSDLINIGQQLLIPSTNTSIEYTVVPGDSLSRIGYQFYTTANEIINSNNLETTVIQVGQVLNIPGNYSIYTVQSGDSLYTIANKYNTTVSKLLRLNNKQNDKLFIGDELYVPI